MSAVFPESWKPLKTILAHDWLTGMRGGEKVLELLCDGFPRAPIYTLLHNPGSVSKRIARHPIHTSWLQTIPKVERHYRYFLPFFPSAIERFRLPEADLLISTSHCVAKGIRPAPGTKHICYCFTPMRYAWTFYEDYFGRNPLKKILLQPTLAALRSWDRRASQRVDRFVAISHHVSDRIRRFYERDCDVVYPPVDTHFYTPGPAGHDHFDLITSALVPYKRLDIAIEAYSQLGWPLKIVGTGTELNALQAKAAPNIQFLGWLPDEQVRELYRQCRLLVFPGEEDFGIVPVEAQACGKPVVAFRRGGVIETVVEGHTGVFFDAQAPEALLQAVKECSVMPWNSTSIRQNAERFSTQKFLDGLNHSIQKCLSSLTA
ncbi:MAG TPA: glycosyltransferase family 4 protein [Verrucomicrobia bacterium]|nr:MAG: hypothetical protein A2X46_12105 [Lentisphaerae bacterium GWF2_57_35]HBA82645.1 glycosyltransferase family 4 protein [Verrucomicrobiota bacterium]